MVDVRANMVAVTQALLILGGPKWHETKQHPKENANILKIG